MEFRVIGLRYAAGEQEGAEAQGAEPRRSSQFRGPLCAWTLPLVLLWFTVKLQHQEEQTWLPEAW